MEFDAKKMKKMMCSGTEQMEKCMHHMKRGRPILRSTGEMKTEFCAPGKKEPMVTISCGGDYKINAMQIAAVAAAMAALILLCRMRKKASVRREIKRHIKEEREKLEAKWEEKLESKLQKEREKLQK